jgi:peroxiredoxin
MKRGVLSAILLNCFIILSAQMIDFSGFYQQRDSLVQSTIGNSYPDFNTVTLDGKRMSTDQFLGKVTMINFWFSACAPCIAEFNSLNDLYNKYKDSPQFQFISFCIDDIKETRKSVEKYQISYDVCLISRKDMTQQFSFVGFPCNILVSQDGKIRLIKVGGKTDPVEVKDEMSIFENMIEDLLLP